MTPMGDGTGPLGQGPGIGRGLGPCGGGQGRGWRGGRGQGGRRGGGARGRAPGQMGGINQNLAAEAKANPETLDTLKQQAGQLEAGLEQIRRRITELSKAEAR